MSNIGSLGKAPDLQAINIAASNTIVLIFILFAFVGFGPYGFHLVVFSF